MLPDADVRDLHAALGTDDGCSWSVVDAVDGSLREAGPTPDDRLSVMVRRRPAGTARWKPFLRALGVPLGTATDAGTESVLVVVQTATDPVRTVVWCFGTASLVVSNELVDSRFGLIVALNKPSLLVQRDAGVAVVAGDGGVIPTLCTGGRVFCFDRCTVLVPGFATGNEDACEVAFCTDEEFPEISGKVAQRGDRDPPIAVWVRWMKVLIRGLLLRRQTAASSMVVMRWRRRKRRWSPSAAAKTLIPSQRWSLSI